MPASWPFLPPTNQFGARLADTPSSGLTADDATRDDATRRKATKRPEGTAAGPLMQSPVPLAAPSGRPQHRLPARTVAIPLVHDLESGFGSYPQVVPNGGH